MAKWGRKLLGLAAASGAIAGLVYYFKKKGADEEDEFDKDFEDDDFDLDSDLQPIDREYVNLNTSPKTEEKKENDSNINADVTEEAEEPAVPSNVDVENTEGKEQ